MNADSDEEDSAIVNNGENDEVNKFKLQADKLRQEIRDMEKRLGRSDSSTNNANNKKQNDGVEKENGAMSLDKKNVLVIGANGRLGSMVCRYLLRNHPKTNVIAAAHYIGENSSTARGYGRLSYEIGAEDGVGSIGAAWDANDRVATFEYTDEMKDYNLRNIRLVEVELLDPTLCFTITQDIDSIIWCASDFNANQPRAISGLNIAFLFRAVTRPDKGIVEIDGLSNILSGWKQQQLSSNKGFIQNQESSDPISFIHVSVEPNAFEESNTPDGTFKDIKLQSERILEDSFLKSYTVLQMSRYDDNFVEEGLDIQLSKELKNTGIDDDDNGNANAGLSRRRINRRDAARATVDALTNPSLINQKVQVWTVEK